MWVDRTQTHSPNHFSLGNYKSLTIPGGHLGVLFFLLARVSISLPGLKFGGKQKKKTQGFLKDIIKGRENESHSFRRKKKECSLSPAVGVGGWVLVVGGVRSKVKVDTVSLTLVGVGESASSCGVMMNVSDRAHVTQKA